MAQGKVPGRGVGSLFGSRQEETAGRSRRKPQGTTPDNDSNAIIPPFGEWNEGSTEDDYTALFNKARAEKKSPDEALAKTMFPATTTPKTNGRKGRRCFPCLGKK